MTSIASARPHNDIRRESQERILAGKYEGLVNRSHWGYRNYVTPSWAVRDFINKHSYIIQAQYTPPQTMRNKGTSGSGKNADEGWRELLCNWMALRLDSTPEAVKRRLYAVMSGEQRTINTAWADTICIILGLDIDHDAQLPILPGSLHSAKEHLTTRAESMDIDLSKNKVTLQRLAHQTIRISALIVAYPKHTGRLQDLAPLDCLRPPS